MVLWLIKKIRKLFLNQQENVKYTIWIDDDRYIASATKGELTVYNYGNSPEMAKEAALYLLHKTIKAKEKDHYLQQQFIPLPNGHKLYRIK
ncbi:hypothetical protein HR057_15850 [Bacillus sp. P2(2020)]|uniref:Uncharacterized protein n=1 Tax=Calidifontibacillus erzurumensis TaxID=2741433 RepID=A0A8J8KFR9_9BACI|nr:hypothetical protein [Calidifontibacillus erzurumensis]